MQIVSNVLLGRGLSKDDFGKFSFIINNIIPVFSVLFVFGQTSTILRLFSSRSIYEYQWKKIFSSFLAIIFIPLAAGTWIVAYYYQLSITLSVILLVGAFLSCCMNMLAGIFRSQGRFNTAVFIERAHAAIFFIFLLYTYFVLNHNDLTTATLLKIGSFIIILPLLLYILVKWKEGPRQIKKNDVMQGLTLWEMSVSVIVLIKINAFFIVKILDYKELALYTIIASIMIIFDFARDAIFSVYSQKFAKIKSFNSKKVIMIIIIISLALSLFYMLSTNLILQILFDGKYSASLLLVFLFCVINILNFLYVIPSCYFLGQGMQLEIRKMTAINIISIVIKVIFIFVFSAYGLVGFLLAATISQGFRTVGGYYISYRKILKPV